MKPTYDDYDILNSQDHMSILLELERKGWLNHSDVSRAKDGGVFNKMYNLINTYDPKTDLDLKILLEKGRNFYRDMNWLILTGLMFSLEIP